MKQFFIAFCLLVALVGCKHDKQPQDDWSEARREMEARGQVLLGEARAALKRLDYEAARQRIHTLRADCGLAFTAREAGILLMDSIDLQEAVNGMLSTDSLIRQQPQQADSLRRLLEEYNQKIKFYRRKLEHDRNAGKLSDSIR